MRLFKKYPLHGFKYAIDGVVHVFRTQRHMRFHFLTLVLVLLVSLVFRLAREEVLILLFTVSLVLTAEMINTAIEAVVDLASQGYHPLAKFAKDVAAGAVLIATINALAVGFLLFFGGGRMQSLTKQVEFHKPDQATVLVIALMLLVVMAVIWKVAGGRGKIWKGGAVSMHSAIGFFIACTILFMSRQIAVGIMAFLLAVLIAQSRVEGGIHSLREVVIGALLATGVAVVVYWVLAPVF
jgi:diacylglycerol kinase (ATP)